MKAGLVISEAVIYPVLQLLVQLVLEQVGTAMNPLLVHLLPVSVEIIKVSFDCCSKSFAATYEVAGKSDEEFVGTLEDSGLIDEEFAATLEVSGLINEESAAKNEVVGLIDEDLESLPMDEGVTYDEVLKHGVTVQLTVLHSPDDRLQPENAGCWMYPPLPLLLLIFEHCSRHKPPFLDEVTILYPF